MMVFLMQLIHDVLVTFIIQVEEEGIITCTEGKETIIERREKRIPGSQQNKVLINIFGVKNV